MGKSYINYDIGVCPKCGADLMNSYLETDMNDFNIDFHYHCEKCGVYGSERYYMEFIDNVAED
jgi:predicted  nucleic acid-binding Zn ribbon protein